MTPELLETKTAIESLNRALALRVQKGAEAVSHLHRNTYGFECSFKMRCLERLSVLIKLAMENCFGGLPVTATLAARGVIETAGLLVLFESRISKLSEDAISERLDTIKKFVFSTKKFGEEKKSVHALDCVRALEAHYADVALLYDILCEAVHPNWLGVSQFKEYGQDTGFAEQDELLTISVVQALFLGHKIASMTAPHENPS